MNARLAEIIITEPRNSAISLAAESSGPPLHSIGYFPAKNRRCMNDILGVGENAANRFLDTRRAQEKPEYYLRIEQQPHFSNDKTTNSGAAQHRFTTQNLDELATHEYARISIYLDSIRKQAEMPRAHPSL
jgi:hypothetical protein